MSDRTQSGFVCPLPPGMPEKILLAHGGGGALMRDLIRDCFLPAFGPVEGGLHDAAVVAGAGGQIAFTTDSYVVRPLFFPGGDIGELAVCGTVNDLAMAGARPLALSAGFILEEGLPLEILQRVVASMAAAARAAGVRIVTGDTKVVERGKADGLYINTAGVGVVPDGLRIHPTQICAGDAIVLSGDIGRHGVAVLAVREGLAFESTIRSDCAALHGVVRSLLDSGVDVHCLRDLTRGGLASALNELADAADKVMEIDETAIPVAEEVRAACELLGLDPLYVACEGRFAAFVPRAQAARAAAVLQAAGCRDANVIGAVQDGAAPVCRVVVRSALGTERIAPLLSGEQLPRIC